MKSVAVNGICQFLNFYVIYLSSQVYTNFIVQ